MPSQKQPHIRDDLDDEQVPGWVKTCLEPAALDDVSVLQDAAVVTLDMKTHTHAHDLPSFLHIVPDRARQNIAEWLTSDPALMILIPMIPRLIPGTS